MRSAASAMLCYPLLQGRSATHKDTKMRTKLHPEQFLHCLRYLLSFSCPASSDSQWISTWTCSQDNETMFMCKTRSPKSKAFHVDDDNLVHSPSRPNKSMKRSCYPPSIVKWHEHNGLGYIHTAKSPGPVKLTGIISLIDKKDSRLLSELDCNRLYEG